MMEQTLLDSSGKRILDATCSYARKWPKHATIRIDIRPETNPDMVMDAKQLSFPNNHFDEIYCDPPHLFRNGPHKTEAQKRRLLGRKSPGFWERYGHWKSKEEWFAFVEKTNNEFYRVLKKDGVLNYKIAEGSSSVKIDDLVQKMTNFDLIKDDYLPSKSNLGKGVTHYLTFKPRLTSEVSG